MSSEIYKIMHLVGVFMVLVPLGAMIIHVANGGEKDHPSRKLLGSTHGVGLVLSLVGGFGLLARLDAGFPGWAVAKLGIWLYFAAMSALVYKKRDKTTLLWIALFLLAGIAAYLARYKPF